MEERIQKLMSQAGLGSRRACEEVIAAGRVTVNGKAVKLGDKADPQQDRIVVDGRLLKLAEKHVYIALYKPRGVLSTVSAPDPRPQSATWWICRGISTRWAAWMWTARD